MKLKIYTLAVAALLMGCANTSPLTSKAETDRTPSSAETKRSEYNRGYKEWPSYVTINYLYGEERKISIQANISLGQIRQIFLNHTSNIENIHDVIISQPSHYPGHTYVEYNIKFKIDYSESVDREADNNFRCQIGFAHNKATNIINVEIRRCRSSNGFIKFGDNYYIHTPLEGPISMKVIVPPKQFIIN